MKLKVRLLFVLLLLLVFYNNFIAGGKENKSNPPIYIAFLWHMHQPIYYPYENILATQASNKFPFSVVDIFNQRIGPYTSWPKNAVQKGIDAGFSHFGAQVSFSGSLIENLNNLENGGNQNFSNWKSSWNNIRTKNTSLGNPRLDLVGFGYFHPLMGLIDELEIEKQIEMHRQSITTFFNGSYSKGIFPPENAFSNKMIPALVNKGLEWILVDNVHFERACKNYPFSTSGNLYEPNSADIQNPDPNDWIQLNGLWAPTKVSARWSHQPHFVEFINPETGESSKIIAVPADRYLGNEDGRGGFGALNYENVLSQLESYNTDSNHPILIVLAHDGDNYGGGSESYYNNNFQNFVNWLKSNSTRFVCTTIQDYLEIFPPDANDVIHIEDGSWSGADNGDPEFKKWNGDPSTDGYSPDRNSWGVITATKNFVYTAEQIDNSNSNTINAWKYLLVGESSDYWYWDGSTDGIWDANPTVAANKSIQYSQNVISSGTDLTPPTIYLPQREPYNPGGKEWNTDMSSEFQVWTYVYDINGLKSVKLKFRTSNSDNSDLSKDNFLYADGNSVSLWTSLEMTGKEIQAKTNPLPLFKAKEYSAKVSGIKSKLVDYYVEAIDQNDNVSKSPIMHVWVGEASGNTNPKSLNWLPENPNINDTITITLINAGKTAKLHWGVNYTGNSWKSPNPVYWPAGSVLFNNSGPAVESPFVDSGNQSYSVKLGPFNNAAQKVSSVAFVIHYADNTWDNNNGADYHIVISEATNAEQNNLPEKFQLFQNYPNPFNPSTTIQYSVPSSTEYYSVLQNVSLKVFDILGREVATLVNEQKPAGTYILQFSIGNMQFSSGMYFYTLRAGTFLETKKMILLR